MALLALLISLVQLVLMVGLGYTYALILASARKVDFPPAGAPNAQRRDFAALVPAHNEAAVIGQTVSGLRAMNYPAERYEVVVVADHCSDQTAALARAAGARVYERKTGPAGSKGEALAWLLEQLKAEARPADAYLIFDADSQADAEFANIMDRALASRALLIQGRYEIADPARTFFNRLADVDMRLNNRLRNAAKQNLGLSGRLMGDGMCLAAELLQRHPWRAGSLVEDQELGIRLLLQGQRVAYAPTAVSRGQAAGAWRSAGLQRGRWAGGVR
ncbi:MAG: glycosyltransferase family 2 protein, partial [Candidatus Promineifilaceae bacterium]